MRAETGDPGGAATAYERAYRLFGRRYDPRRLQALHLLLATLGPAADADGPALDRFERWLEVLVREVVGAMQARETPAQVNPALAAARAGIARYRELAPERWDDAPKVLHDMTALLERLSEAPDTLGD